MNWLMRILEMTSGPTKVRYATESENSWRRILPWLSIGVALALGVVIVRFMPDLTKISEHDLLVLILISIWLKGR